jgi:hypothetical protein
MGHGHGPQEGASLVEYALIVAGIAVIAAALFLVLPRADNVCLYIAERVPVFSCPSPTPCELVENTHSPEDGSDDGAAMSQSRLPPWSSLVTDHASEIAAAIAIVVVVVAGILIYLMLKRILG